MSESCDEAEEWTGGGEGAPAGSLDVFLEKLLDLSRSDFMQLDSSCLDKYDLRAKHLPHLLHENGLSVECVCT